MVRRRKDFSSFQNSTKNDSDIPVLKELIAQETVHHHTLSLMVTQSEHADWVAGTILVSTFYPSVLVTQRSAPVWATKDMVIRCEEKRRKRDSQIFPLVLIIFPRKVLLNGSKKVLVSPSEMVPVFLPKLPPERTE